MIVVVPGLISLISFLLSFTAFVVLTISAFKISFTRGALCLIVPFFVFYHATNEYTERGKRGAPVLLIGGFLGGVLFQGIGWWIL